MPYSVNGQLVPEELIKEEFGRIGRDPQWNVIADLNERASRLRAAAEQCAQERLLIEQAAASDPRPVDAIALQQEIQRQQAQWGCRSAFDHDQLRWHAERSLRVQRIRREMVAGALKPTAEELEAFFNANRDKFEKPEMFRASHIVKYVNHEQTEEQAESGIEAFSPPNGRPRPSLPGLAIRKKPVLWPFLALFVGALTGLTAFRSAYLGPQACLCASPIG
jgi:hypothetical protein